MNRVHSILVLFVKVLMHVSEVELVLHELASFGLPPMQYLFDVLDSAISL